MTLCEHGPDKKCGRKAVARGMCHSPRRMWLAGKPIDQPVRGYQKYEQGPDGKVTPVRASRGPVPGRKPRFAAEMRLLKELGLR